MKRIQATSCISDAISLQRTAYRSSRAFTTTLRCPSFTPSTRKSTLNSRSPLLNYNSNPRPLALARRYASSDTPPAEMLGRTALYDVHLAHGATMVPFAGFSMPVQYSSQSLIESHLFTRTKASLFDVSHMVQYRFWGDGVDDFLESITPAGLKDLGNCRSTLSVLLNDEGGIVDDTILTRLSPTLFAVVTNAGCREKDLKYFQDKLRAWQKDGKRIGMKKMAQRGLLAIQGPGSEEILQGVLKPMDKGGEVNLKELYFGQSMWGRIPPSKRTEAQVATNQEIIGTMVFVTRGGYTGEDGFEISIWNNRMGVVVNELMDFAGPEKLQFAGLGARDSLRLEAGMCLYGHDIDETTTPVEAGLSWVIGKDRRETGGFPGAETILKQLVPKSKGGAGVERRRVGLIVEGPPAREGAEIVDEQGEKIGIVTSGCPSPSLGKNIAMGYIKDGFHAAGTNVEVVVREKKRKAVVTKMPFVPTKYYKGVAPAK